MHAVQSPLNCSHRPPPSRQVLELYMQYAETDVVAKYGVNAASWKVPNVRTLVKPLLGLFYAEPGSKRWKAALDVVLKQVRPWIHGGHAAQGNQLSAASAVSPSHR